jgi:hypothetical protein
MQLFEISPQRLTSLLVSRSPLRRHVSELILPEQFALTPARLGQLCTLPALTLFQGTLDGSLQEWTAADWRSSLPSRLRELVLDIPDSITLTAHQHLIDALPAIQDLRRLILGPSDRHTADPQLSAPLLLERLLQLPQLKELIWNIGDLTLSQLAVVKHIRSLRHLSSHYGRWSAEQLSFLSQPPHRLDQLEEVQLFHTDVSSAHMSALFQLPGITRIGCAQQMPLDAFAMLPRLPRLQQLALDLPQLTVSNDADRETILSSLRACSALTDVEIDDGECSEATGERLLRALPHLHKLSIVEASIPSLRFLRYAPSLTALELYGCRDLRAGHILALGSLLPRLERLELFDRGRLLDEMEARALKPPGAIGLPNLSTFVYDVNSDEEEEE